jgi:Rrf2 family transcriptional regulator, iron-sulfur cluster assembly transcription factor
MITQTGRYALRILGYLVDHPGHWVQGSQIASETGIPANYLSKILNQLRKRGFVLSQKGWGGGFLFRDQASRVPISEVLDLFEGRKENGQCIFGLRQCDAANPCPLHEQWAHIQGAYHEMLESRTVGDLRSLGGKS